MYTAEGAIPSTNVPVLNNWVMRCFCNQQQQGVSALQWPGPVGTPHHMKGRVAAEAGQLRTEPELGLVSNFNILGIMSALPNIWIHIFNLRTMFIYMPIYMNFLIHLQTKNNIPVNSWVKLMTMCWHVLVRIQRRQKHLEGRNTLSLPWMPAGNIPPHSRTAALAAVSEGCNVCTLFPHSKSGRKTSNVNTIVLWE